jgi:hypothetical protein
MERIGAISVIHLTNPIHNNDRVIKKHVIENGELLSHFLESAGYLKTAVKISHNGIPVNNEYYKTAIVRNNDSLVIKTVAQEPVTAAVTAFLIEAGASAAIASAVASFAVSTIISFATSYLISALTGTESSTPQNRPKDSESYGVAGGGNQIRLFQPFQIPMGTHRIFPDYGSRFFTDYVLGDIEIITSGDLQLQDVSPPPFDFPNAPSGVDWINYTLPQQQPSSPWVKTDFGNGWGNIGGIAYYTDGQAITYTKPDGEVVEWPWTFIIKWEMPNDSAGAWDENGSNVTATTWEDFIVVDGEPNWRDPTGLFSVPTGYKRAVQRYTQRLTNIFNYGFGDLTISDHYIGSTPSSNYDDITITNPVFTPTSTLLNGWVKSGGGTIQYPSNVESVAGAALKGGNTIQRESSRNANYLEVDFSGRIFEQVNGSIAPATLQVNIQYKPIAGGSWTTVSGSPFTLENPDTTAYRRTIGWTVPNNTYAVRVTKITPDSDNSNLVQELNFEQFKAYGTVSVGYPAQNRLGVQIRASGQLNGALDRWSSLVTVKTWVFTGTTWNGQPAGGTEWTWTTTNNPAWWYLYFALGGYYNTSDPKGWTIGENVNNGLRMFGAGIEHARIDYDSIVRFAKYCTDKDLQFGATLDSQKPVIDVLRDIARVGRGSPTWANGKLGVIFRQQGDPAVQMFGMSNIIKDSFNIGYISEKTSDVVILTYNDRDDFYGSRQIRAVVPGITQPVTEAGVQLWGCTRKSQAEREARLIAAEQKYHRRRITWEADLDGSVCQRWDVVTLAHDLTSWAVSGRIVEFKLAGGNVKSVILDRDLALSETQSAFIQWRKPDGTFVSSGIASGLVDAGDEVVLTGVISASDASFYLNQLGDLTNSASSFEVFPEDFVYHCGPSIFGKRVRILSVEPQADGTNRITATDESEAWYANETASTYITEPSNERLVAKVFNAGVIVDDDGQTKLVWELDNCHGADITVSSSTGGGFSTGSLTVPGVELILPNYSVGTVLSISLSPTVTTPIFAIESTTVSWTKT